MFGKIEDRMGSIRTLPHFGIEGRAALAYASLIWRWPDAVNDDCRGLFL
jgi:hypothetical protein